MQFSNRDFHKRCVLLICHFMQAPPGLARRSWPTPSPRRPEGVRGCVCVRNFVWYRMHARIKNECASTRTHIRVCNTYMYGCMRARARAHVCRCIVDRCISCMDYSMCRCKGSRIWARMEGGRGGEPSTARILAEGEYLHRLEGFAWRGPPSAPV